MFHQKYHNDLVCDAYLNLYDACNIGCSFCKFHSKVRSTKKTPISWNSYRNQKVLVCYSVDPYPLGYDLNLVPEVILKLHQRDCSIVFLTRRAQCLISDLDCFNSKDCVGVSISEKGNQNSPLEEIDRLFALAKRKQLSTWISLEPVMSFSFVKEVLDRYASVVDWIRIGKNDLTGELQGWQLLKQQILSLSLPNVLVKD